VEDEQPVRRLIARILGMQSYRVLEAGHGEEALSISEDYGGEIHLLVTDIMMPIMNGHELASRLASLRPGMPVLFISGYPGKHLPESLDQNASVDYLAKPFKVDNLLEKVKSLLR
jgi:two-component system cell cycle sensor histidine kinase/response regulator CckA